MIVPVSPSTAVSCFSDTYHVLYIHGLYLHVGSPTSIFLTSSSSASSVPPSVLVHCTPQLVVHSESSGPSPSWPYISDRLWAPRPSAESRCLALIRHPLLTFYCLALFQSTRSCNHPSFLWVFCRPPPRHNALDCCRSSARAFSR